MERGTNKAPRTKTILALATALGVTEEEFRRLWTLAKQARDETPQDSDLDEEMMSLYLLDPSFQSEGRTYRPDIVARDEEGRLYVLGLQHRSLSREVGTLREEVRRAQELAYQRAMELDAVQEQVHRLMLKRQQHHAKQARQQALREEIEQRERELEKLRIALRNLQELGEGGEEQH